VNPAVIFVLFAVVAIAAIAIGLYFDHKRKEMWRSLAARYGLRYHPGDPFGLADRYSFALFGRGHSRRVSNTLHGATDGMDVTLFDYRYTTGSGKNKRTHYWSALMVRLPCRGALHIRPENFLDRIAAAVGFDDFDFEYEAFNRAFKVTGPSKKFAYDVCHAQMMEYLLQHPDHCWEIQQDQLLLYSSSLGRFDPNEVQRCLRDARGFIERLPSYLCPNQD
jgi:hypothetical protein